MTDKRIKPRMARRIPSDYRAQWFTDDGRSGDVHVVEISLTGLAIVGLELPNVREEFDIELEIGGDEDSGPFRARAHVAYMSEDGELLRVGAAFIGVDQEALNLRIRDSQIFTKFFRNPFQISEPQN